MQKLLAQQTNPCGQTPVPQQVEPTGPQTPLQQGNPGPSQQNPTSQVNSDKESRVPSGFAEVGGQKPPLPQSRSLPRKRATGSNTVTLLTFRLLCVLDVSSILDSLGITSSNPRETENYNSK